MALSLKTTSSHVFCGHSRPARRYGAVAPLRPVALANALSGDDAPLDSDYVLTADCIAWNAMHRATLKQRIAQVRAAEIVAESTEQRPELPSGPQPTAEEITDDHRLLCKWHEEQWQKLRFQWDDLV